MNWAAPGGLGIAYLVLLCLGAGCAQLPAPPPATANGYRYVDGRDGVAVELPPGWRGFQRRSELPEALRDMIPPGFGPKPAMVGLDDGGLAFARVLTEPVLAMTTLEYFAALYEGTRGQVEVLGAAYSRERDTVRWRFRAPAGALEFAFVETLAVRRGRAIRLAFWTASSLAASYTDEFSSIAGEALLYEGTGWSAPWRALEPSLDPGFFADLELAEASELDPVPECAGAPRGLLWKVSTDRGALFLFPSLHVGHPDMYPLPGAVEEAFAGADRLVVEVDVRSSRLAEEMAGAGEGEDAASAELTPSQRAGVEERLAALGVPPSRFAQLPPWVLAATLEILEWQALGYFAEFGVDRYFLKRAGTREVVELESAAEQTAALERIGAPLLDHTLRTLDGMAARARPAVAAWYCGDAPTLARLSGEADAEMPRALQQVLYDERNETMADRLEPLLDGPGVTFVTVGLGHFLGPSGLPALLERRGHTLERQ